MSTTSGYVEPKILTHSGLKAAVMQQFTGAAWRRCRVHLMRNLRRADVVEILSIPAAFLRQATVVIEQHDEWQVTRRYVSDVSMVELRAVIAAKEHAAAEPAHARAGYSKLASIQHDSLITTRWRHLIRSPPPRGVLSSPHWPGRSRDPAGLSRTHNR
ncbi:hypothetical protein GON09_005473 [Rhodococcus sp. B50]|nr:hypothetical protein [Rhodococcus sp. B50]